MYGTLAGVCLLDSSTDTGTLTVASRPVKALSSFQSRRCCALLTAHSGCSVRAPDPEADPIDPENAMDQGYLGSPLDGAGTSAAAAAPCDAPCPDWIFECTTYTMPWDVMVHELLPLSKAEVGGERDPVLAHADLLAVIERHYGHTWDLVHKLFEAIEVPGGSDSTADVGERMDERGDGVLVRARRKRGLSTWLEQQVGKEVEAAVLSVRSLTAALLLPIYSVV